MAHQSADGMPHYTPHPTHSLARTSSPSSFTVSDAVPYYVQRRSQSLPGRAGRRRRSPFLIFHPLTRCSTGRFPLPPFDPSSNALASLYPPQKP